MAFYPLGWRAAWLSEIEPFPSAVLAHHYPDVPNLGDMTRLPASILTGEATAPDVLCGGKPGQGVPCVACTTKLHNTGSNNSGKIFEERTTCLDASSPPPALLTAMQVRRLTPVECERLMGFPDGYTAIPWRKKPASECPDGPRYKALGNSWAVPVVAWIARRIHRQIAT